MVVTDTISLIQKGELFRRARFHEQRTSRILHNCVMDVERQFIGSTDNDLEKEKTAIALPGFDSSVHREAGYCRLPFVERNPPPSGIPLPVCCCISTIKEHNRNNVNAPFNAILVGVLLMLDFGHPILFNETEKTDGDICGCFYLLKRGDCNEGLYYE